MMTKMHICYMCIGGLGSVYTSSLVGGSVSAVPRGLSLDYFVGILVASLTLWLPVSFLLLFHSTPQVQPIAWSWVSVSVSISCQTQPL